MPAQVASIKVETPKNIDAIFSLDCFKFNEMKGLFKNIYEYLTKFGLQMEDLNRRLGEVPDFKTLEQKLKDLEKRMTDNEKFCRDFRGDYEKYTRDTDDKIKNNFDEIMARIEDHEERIKILEDEVDGLKKRPVSEGNIDYDALCSKEDFLDLLERMNQVEKRNHEQDDRLTNNEIRIEKLEKMISDPLERIQALELRCDNI